MFTLHRTTRIAVCSCVAVLAGCANKENAAVDTSSAMASSTASTTTSVAPAAPAAPAAVNLADVAGKWNMRAVPFASDVGEVDGCGSCRSCRSYRGSGGSGRGRHRAGSVYRRVLLIGASGEDRNAGADRRAGGAVQHEHGTPRF